MIDMEAHANTLEHSIRNGSSGGKPTVEIRFEHLTVEADCHFGERALPTLPNAALNIAETALGCLGIQLVKRTKLTILNDTSGMIKPSRMTLLLGPPSSGKTTLLLALAGRLDPSLKVKGDVTYNGHGLDEFIPKKTSMYVSQNDVHLGELTVRETLEFSERCQGSRSELLSEHTTMDKGAKVFPDSEFDTVMTEKEMENNNITDMIVKILGLEICQDTMVGDDMRRGISGGQKKRVTTGEVIVGPIKALLMDEISTGLDSSTTLQILKCLQQICYVTEATMLISLLQPAPEAFELFDDIILLSEGHIVYHGPRLDVLDFFENCGFKCPKRKGVADFLQEVTSRKDQHQYWADRSTPYEYITATQLSRKFKSFHVGLQLQNNLSIPYDKSWSHPQVLSKKKYSVPQRDLLMANFHKEWLFMKRNSFFYLFNIFQIIVITIVASTVFLKPTMHTKNEEDGATFIGALSFALTINVFNGFPELVLTIQRLPVLYKHRDLLFHPTWAFTLPIFLLRIPICLIEAIVWMGMTYYQIGFAPESSRFFKQFLLIFLIQQMSLGMFRLIGGVCRTMVITNTAGTLSILSLFLLGGFILPKGLIPIWWRWGGWASPLSYAFNALAVNEMFSPRWMDRLASDNSTRLGVAVLKEIGVVPEEKWFWIGAAALLGFTILFNVLFTFALKHLNPLAKPQAFVSKEQMRQMDTESEEPTEKQKLGINKPSDLLHSSSELSTITTSHSTASKSNGSYDFENENSAKRKKGMVLPFTPHAMSFDSISYFVDMPQEMKEKGAAKDKLQLLHEVSGVFRPGVLTALMGVSGAGKTTLMDVLSGRKTGGYIEGEIRISGFPKKQETFARVSGYCEQNDIHSPQVTVHESLLFSAFLRLQKEVNKEEKMIFVNEVMELVELDNLKDAIVGIPGVSGLSTEQRKRLTIAVELVANPSIIFMDEPTSGLDARAAAIVMRTVRNTVETGRTVVCTIHQPSIDIFESFDELLLLKTGGQVIYGGPLGKHSQKVIEYFESIPGVPEINDGINPATWMLEVSSAVTEQQLGIDFSEHYKSSCLYLQNKALVKDLSVPLSEAKDLAFPTQHAQDTWGQFRTCLWKQWMSYWRSPHYNLGRFIFSLAAALMVGTIFWRVGSKRDNDKNLLTIIGAMYMSVMFIGINNCSSIQPIIAGERTVFYRERAAGMYSALPYAMSQVVSEIPYVLVQTTYYTLIVYSMMSFEWTAKKYLWFYFVSFFSFLYFTCFGMMTISITPSHQVAAVLSGGFYTLFNLFTGFFVPRPKIPLYWIWFYWICPLSWSIYGFIVSQFGDVEDTIKVSGMFPDPMIKDYIKQHFGYDPNFMGAVAVVLAGFPIFFLIIYSYCLKKLNFQTR